MCRSRAKVFLSHRRILAFMFGHVTRRPPNYVDIEYANQSGARSAETCLTESSVSTYIHSSARRGSSSAKAHLDRLRSTGAIDKCTYDHQAPLVIAIVDILPRAINRPLLTLTDEFAGAFFSRVSNPLSNVCSVIVTSHKLI